jgi:hypothetical protein
LGGRKELSKIKVRGNGREKKNKEEKDNNEEGYRSLPGACSPKPLINHHAMKAYGKLR